VNNTWPAYPMFASATYPEYLDAIAQVEGGVIGEGSAINLVRFQCSIQYLRDLIVTRQLRSWAVVDGGSVQHLRYSASDLVGYGLQVGWFNSFSDMGIRVLSLTEEVFNRLKAEAKVEGAEVQRDYFPDSVAIKRVLSPAEPGTLPDYLIGLLLSRGNGLLDAEATRGDSDIEWVFTRQGTATGESLYSCPPQLFRPTLATFASRLNIPRHAGHTFFSVRYENEAAACPGRFSFYLSNTGISGYWAKLFLYGVPPSENQSTAQV